MITLVTLVDALMSNKVSS